MQVQVMDRPAMRDEDMMLAEGVRGRFDKVFQHVIIECRLYGDAGVEMCSSE